MMCSTQTLLVTLTFAHGGCTHSGMKYDELYDQLGTLIRNRRKKLLLTQRDLAARIGISRASLANIETGRQKVLVHQLYALATALDLAPSDLLPPSMANES